jgi:hypothetical protein
MTARYTDAEKAEEALREARMRRRVYPGLISAGRKKPDEASRQIALMDEIAAEYAARAKGPRLL